jgi:hypothetical protein
VHLFVSLNGLPYQAFHLWANMGKFSGPDFIQNLLRRFAGLTRIGATGEIATLCSVSDGMTHISDPVLVNQVKD